MSAENQFNISTQLAGGRKTNKSQFFNAKVCSVTKPLLNTILNLFYL